MTLFETTLAVVFLVIIIYIWILITDNDPVRCDYCKSKMDYVCRTRVVSPVKGEPDILQITYKCPKCGAYKTITEDV